MYERGTVCLCVGMYVGESTYGIEYIGQTVCERGIVRMCVGM